VPPGNEIAAAVTRSHSTRLRKIDIDPELNAAQTRAFLGQFELAPAKKIELINRRPLCTSHTQLARP
jgi:hypothetical protein